MRTNAQYENVIRSYGADVLPTMLFVPAFGDDSGVFSPLAETQLARRYRLVTFDLPGFGGTPRLETPATLENLADVVHLTAAREQARIVVAHSVGSITASLAARRETSTIDTIISLEGNLTAEDAYHSGTAAHYDNAADFRRAFLARLDSMAKDQPVIARYRSAVAKADPQSLWELGCDAYEFSSKNIPGDVLTETKNVYYLYNPDNCPNVTLEWLRNHPIRRLRMDGASHWKSVDQPHFLADKILQALNDRS